MAGICPLGKMNLAVVPNGHMVAGQRNVNHMKATTTLPPRGSIVFLSSWKDVTFIVSRVSHESGLIHVRGRVSRGILTTSAAAGEFVVL